jgi:hypothetical protein
LPARQNERAGIVHPSPKTSADPVTPTQGALSANGVTRAVEYRASMLLILAGLAVVVLPAGSTAVMWQRK